MLVERLQRGVELERQDVDQFTGHRMPISQTVTPVSDQPCPQSL